MKAQKRTHSVSGKMRETVSYTHLGEGTRSPGGQADADYGVYLPAGPGDHPHVDRHPLCCEGDSDDPGKHLHSQEKDQGCGIQVVWKAVYGRILYGDRDLYAVPRVTGGRQNRDDVGDCVFDRHDAGTL